MENGVGMAYTLANHACLQVLSIGVLVRFLAPITSHNDERTRHAEL
jgi:hypothetical protein